MLSLVLAAAAFSASASNDWLSLRKRTILSVWPDGGGALPSDACAGLGDANQTGARPQR